MNRRSFLLTAGTLAATRTMRSAPGSGQTFVAGLVPGGPPMSAGNAAKSAPRSPVESFWLTCDECQQLGVHYIEVNNTHRPIVDAYEGRISEFRDEMAKRGLTMAGFAMYSHMHLPALRQELVDSHVRVARFLKAVGGKYMDPLIAPGDNLGNGTDEEYRRVDIKATAANANEIGKRVREETGIPVGLHPEQGDIRAGLVDPLMDTTDPRWFNLWPDVGHFVACGVEPMGVYRKYRSRMVGTHLRDYQPPATATDPTGKPAHGRMVPFGQGVIKLPDLVAFLRETSFTGCVMGEGGGTHGMRDYMVDTLKLEL